MKYSTEYMEGDRELKKYDQRKTPLFDALKTHIEEEVVPFHVPGHKHGKGLKEYTDYVGETVMKMDVNGMEDLDNANNPVSVIRESQELLADAFKAEHAYFLNNGTSQGVQTMIMSACDPGEKIIIPRNAHKSTIGGIILSGAIPVYVPPVINEQLGIAMAVESEVIREALSHNPHIKSVFIVNPTYYGAVSDLKSIVRAAHRRGASVLVDEAHGAHMAFNDDFPLTAMEVGADMSASSTHKTVGSLTQSSILLLRGNKIAPERVKQTLGLTHTTSSSYLLMTSVDVARKQLALEGEDLLEETLRLARYARAAINEIPGLYAFGTELVGQAGCYDMDETKLGIHVRRLGLTGYEMEKILRWEYKIQVEMADLYNVMAIITIGDTKENLDRLIQALREIAEKQGVQEVRNATQIPHVPELIVTPRDAFYSHKKAVRLEDSVGEIAAEMIMAYPPGIPVVCPGERITKEVVDYVKVLKEENCQLQGTADPYADYIRVLGM